MTLYDISDEILRLDECLNNVSEDDDEGEEAILKGYISTLRNDLSNKLDNYAAYIKELETRSDLRKDEAKRILQRSKIDADRAERLKAVLKWFFQTSGMSSYETPRYRVSLCNNGGKLPVEVLVPIQELPVEYVREITTIQPDMEKLRQDLESGIVLDVARLGERGSSIRIK